MALQDLVGHGLPYASGGRASGEGRRRETSLWRSHREAGAPVSRRPPPPSGRARRAHMPRRTFLTIAFGWAFVVATLAAAILAIRWFG
jgi:hypothetical protein